MLRLDAIFDAYVISIRAIFSLLRMPEPLSYFVRSSRYFSSSRDAECRRHIRHYRRQHGLMPLLLLHATAAIAEASRHFHIWFYLLRHYFLLFFAYCHFLLLPFHTSHYIRCLHIFIFMLSITAHAFIFTLYSPVSYLLSCRHDTLHIRQPHYMPLY